MSQQCILGHRRIVVAAANDEIQYVVHVERKTFTAAMRYVSGEHCRSTDHKVAHLTAGKVVPVAVVVDTNSLDHLIGRGSSGKAWGTGTRRSGKPISFDSDRGWER